MNEPKETANITWHAGLVSRADREKLLGQRGCVLWFTGLSGSGKSTIAGRVERMLLEGGRATYLLDGDNIRHGLNRGLGFSEDDRQENLRRVGEVAKLFVDAGTIVLAAFVSPFRADRAAIRGLLGEGDFIEVYVDTPLEVCEQRDPKGLYRRARAGEIKDFTGIHQPYEPPAAPEVHLETAAHDVESCAGQVLAYLAARAVSTG